MIQKNNPEYRIKYRNCTIHKNHADQALNFVCLNEKCTEHSLICSMCRNGDHLGHNTQPLKFYIQQLKKEYKAGSKDYDKDFQVIQELRINFLFKLKQTVEKVADQFKRLEEDVINHLEELKSQLIEERTKKDKFTEFYNSLISEQGQKPQFLIQNYLPKKSIGHIKNIDVIEKAGAKFSKMIQDTRLALFDEKFQQIKLENVSHLYSLAENVTINKNLFTQTNFANNAKCVNALKVDLLSQFKGKIRIKVNKLKKGGSIYLGAIQKAYYESLNHLAPAQWNNLNNKGKIFYINNVSYAFGHTKSQLKTFSENSNLEVTMSGLTMKISMKKNSGEFLLPQGKFFFFFGLIGQSQLEINYIP